MTPAIANFKDAQDSFKSETGAEAICPPYIS